MTESVNRRRDHLFELAKIVSIFGVPAFGFALFVDALGDVVKDEWGFVWNRDWAASVTAPHSRPESAVIVVVCLLLITVALCAAARNVDLAGMKWLERMALLLGLLIAPLLGLKDSIASVIERVIGQF